MNVFGQTIDNEFEGTWTLVKENGQWKMDESNIKNITPIVSPSPS